MKEKHFLAVPIWAAIFFIVQFICFGAYVLYRFTSYESPDISSPYEKPEHYTVEEEVHVPEQEDFQSGQKAVFDFTGDTVLVLGKSTDLDLFEAGYWTVLYKDENANMVEQDLPAEALIPLDTDTTQTEE